MIQQDSTFLIIDDSWFALSRSIEPSLQVSLVVYPRKVFNYY